jgi:acyl-CoA synthetase (AMP-forming)/AMP-acid ligase II
MVTYLSCCSDSRYADMRPSDTLLMLLPMFHTYMFVCQLVASMVGMKVVVISKFEEHMFLRTIEKHKVLYPFNITLNCF